MGKRNYSFVSRKATSATDNSVENIKKLVASLIKNPNLELNPEKMKKIRDLCKSSEENVSHLYYFLMMQLRKEHAEIRYIILLAINDFFVRSHFFRKLLENDFEEFMELTMETEPRKPLPPPSAVAERLRISALHYIKEWHNVFSAKHSVIRNAYSYLRTCKKVDFGPVTSSESTRPNKSGTTEVFRTKKEMEEHSDEIFTVLTQIERCFQLVLPLPDDLFSESDFIGTTSVSPKTNDMTELDSHASNSEPCGSLDVSSLRQHGIYGMKSTVTVELNKISTVTVEKNENTAPFLESLNDMYDKIVNTYLPMTSRWLKVFAKNSDCSSLVKKATDLKKAMEAKVSKYRQLQQHVNLPMLKDSDVDDSSDSDFEEVKEKEGYEATVPELTEACSSVTSYLPSVKSCEISASSSGSSESSSFRMSLPENSTMDKRITTSVLDMPSTSSHTPSVPDWQDPVLLADIKAATGIDLKLREKKGKDESKKGEPSLKHSRTDLKAASETTYKRLHKNMRKLKRCGKK